MAGGRFRFPLIESEVPDVTDNNGSGRQIAEDHTY
jgi:hypothetical protein